MPHIDYESWGFKTQRGYLSEAYRGTDAVAWHRGIQRQIDRMIAEYREDGDESSVKILEQFQTTWKNNKLSGSINVDDVRTLLAASDQAAASNMKLKSFFDSLSANLEVLIASEEELPRGYDQEAMPTPKRSKKPETQFAAQKEKPASATGPEEPPIESQA